MTRLSVAFAAIGATAALGACAPTADTVQTASDRGARQCFFTSTVNSFRTLEGERRDTVAVRAGTRDEYELEPLGVCRDLRWSQALAIKPALSSGNSLCVGDLADVTSRPGGGTPEQCQVRVVRKVEPDTTDAG